MIKRKNIKKSDFVWWHRTKDLPLHQQKTLLWEIRTILSFHKPIQFQFGAESDKHRLATRVL